MKMLIAWVENPQWVLIKVNPSEVVLANFFQDYVTVLAQAGTVDNRQTK